MLVPPPDGAPNVDSSSQHHQCSEQHADNVKRFIRPDEDCRAGSDGCDWLDVATVGLFQSDYAEQFDAAEDDQHKRRDVLDFEAVVGVRTKNEQNRSSQHALGDEPSESSRPCR